MTGSRRVLVIAVAVLAVVAIAGSLVIGSLSAVPGPEQGGAPTASASGGPAPSESPAPSQGARDSPLLPVYPDPFTAETVAAESNRVGDLLVGFVDASESGAPNVVNDDAIAQVVPADESGGSYFGVLHTLTLDPSVDATTQVEALRSALVDGGWSEQEVTDTPAQYLLAFTSDPDTPRSWFLVVGADRSEPEQSVVSIQLASPDLP